jgi:hypothetical protein
MDSHTIQPRSAKKETLQFNGIPMVIENHSLVVGEERRECIRRERMGMQARVGQDEQVGYIHDAYTKFRSESSQERRCCDDFEVYFNTNTDKYAMES